LSAPANAAGPIMPVSIW